MTKIEWDSSLSVGVDLIDDQHKELIQRLAAISEAVEMTQSADKIGKTLQFMVEYTNEHFSTEEKYMVQLGYPYQEEHLSQHEEFKGMLKTLIEDFQEDGATDAVGKSINVFLLNWLITHIKGIDVKFGQFLHERGFVPK